MLYRVSFPIVRHDDRDVPHTEGYTLSRWFLTRRGAESIIDEYDDWAVVHFRFQTQLSWMRWHWYYTIKPRYYNLRYRLFGWACDDLPF